MTDTQWGFSCTQSLPQPANNKKRRNATPHWISAKERGGLTVLRLMTWFARLCGRPAARVLLYPIALYYLCTAGRARRASRDYLQRIYGRTARWHDVFAHIHAFASVLLDRVYFLLERHDTFDIRIVHNDYIALDGAERAKGIFLLGAHMGSFEVMRLLARRQQNEKLQLVLLMYEDNARHIGAQLAAINSEAQQEIVALGQLSTMLKVKERLAQGALVGMLADRSLGQDKTALLPFLGQPAPFAQGPFRMAALLRRPVYLMMGLYLGGNRYDIHIERIADFTDAPNGARRNSEACIQTAMTHYVQRLEYFAHLAPFNWFNFYDFWQHDA